MKKLKNDEITLVTGGYDCICHNMPHWGGATDLEKTTFKFDTKTACKDFCCDTKGTKKYRYNGNTWLCEGNS